MIWRLLSAVDRDWRAQVLGAIARVLLLLARPHSDLVVEVHVRGRSYLVTAAPTLRIGFVEP